MSKLLTHGYRGRGVRHSSELDRILRLPRRDPIKPAVQQALTEYLKTPEGTQKLRPAQVMFLKDLFEHRGVFANMRVGSGKTLPTLVAGTLLELPTVLLVPSELVDKTKEEATDDYAPHWDFEMPKVLGYGMLSHKNHARDLFKLRPKLLLADEAQYLFNPEAACTVRVGEYLEYYPDTVFAALSGSLIDPSLMRYHHLMLWSVGARGMPLPADYKVAVAWAQALDPEPPEGKPRIDLGALRVFGDDRDEANAMLGECMAATPGVVYTRGKGIKASLRVCAWKPKRLAKEVLKTIAEVRSTKKRPDGVDLDDAEVGLVCSQLENGFYLHWEPEGPPEWMKARKEWYQYWRRVVRKRFPGLDSMARVEDAIDTEQLEIRELEAWREVRSSFKPRSVAVWMTKSVMEEAAAFALAQPTCVVWTRYKCMGRALEKLGLPHFGRKGIGPDGTSIQRTKAKHISASIRANSTGRNLQRYGHALLLNPFSEVRGFEQTIGRHHREGTKYDTVYFHVHNTKDMRRVLRKAKHLGRVGGFDPKLSIADYVGF